ncbi:MAG: hypothetical protein QGH94_03545 [Phycisphaerae bacterium]|nr:hypothetical protein [Phycisphaerae bacterium]
MYHKSMFLLLLCFVATTMLVAGCGNGAEEPEEPDNPTPATKPAPVVTPPVVTPPVVTPPVVTPPVVTPPVVTPPVVTPPVVTPPVVTPPVVKPPTVTPPVTPKVAPADTKIKTAWADAKVGTMLKYKMQNSMTMTQEVIKVTDDTVTVKVTTVIPAMPAPMVRNQDFPRYVTPNPAAKPDPDQKPASYKSKKLPDETLTVGDKSIKCEVWQTVTDAGGKKITSKSYMSKEIPGGVVRNDSDMMGKMAPVMELVEFKE